MINWEFDGRTVPLSQLGAGSGHEWSAPPAKILLTVAGTDVIATGDVSGESLDLEPQSLAGASATLNSAVKEIKSYLEAFRTSSEGAAYLDDVDSTELTERLSSYHPKTVWGTDHDDDEKYAEERHVNAWNNIAVLAELRRLARQGYEVYDTLFPQETPLRQVLDKLPRGTQVKVSWALNAPGAIYIPWGLLYRVAPSANRPTDPTEFWGLRYRVAYRAQLNKKSTSRYLGSPTTNTRLNLIFNDVSDAVVNPHAQWQRDLWTPLWPNLIFVPNKDTNNQEQEIIQLLEQPDVSYKLPTNVLYLYCHCGTQGNASTPILRFGNGPTGSVRGDDISQTSLERRPMVFANACSTSASDPLFVNEFMQGFLKRGCRAFVGTEARIPPIFSARFAHVFFYFFQQGDVAAGEALTQARLFFWLNYRNIGGLFYSLVNEYELFLRDNP